LTRDAVALTLIFFFKHRCYEDSMLKSRC